MDIKSHDQFKTGKAAAVAAGGSIARVVAASRERWLMMGLPAKLLLLTSAFVMIAEVLIFVPSVANYRVSWLSDRLTAAQVAALAAEAVPGGEVPPKVRAELLRTAQVKAVAIRRDGLRRVVLPADDTIVVDAFYDLRPGPDGVGSGILNRFVLIRDAIDTFVAGHRRTIRVIGPVGANPNDFIEIVIPEAPLRKVMLSYGFNILALSILISLITAALVYLALSRLLVQPMMRLTRNMVRFSENPEDPERIIVPSGRADEIGIAERELAQMQRDLSQLFLQKSRLAALGLAVSKINHDLRNMLANAQLISDRLTDIPDPTVQRFAPKLIASLDRAINFCNDSLRFGRAEEATPRRELMRLLPLVDEVGDSLLLPHDGVVDWRIDMDANLRIDADRDHLFRVLSNLVRNAVQAIEGQEDRAGPGIVQVRAWREVRKVLIEVSDDGPGVPRKARETLFQAFQGARKGGTGLGLAIAAELIAAHGGRVRLLDTAKGAAFQIEIPDRSVHA
ncbi:MAG: sensor histidine kinase [Hyphomicrobiaceae bacterium]